MEKLILVLDRKEMQVTPDAGTIRIDCPGRRFQRVPVKMIGSVIISGSPLVSCGVWMLLAKESIPAVILPSRGKGPAVFVGAGLSATAEKRLRQHEVLHDRERSLALARLFVRRKLEGQKNLLMGIGFSGPDVAERFDKCFLMLNAATNNPAIMGIEGAAAAFYFKCLGTTLPAGWCFKRRSRRPPRDPFNSLLSLGYTLAAAEVRGDILTSGFDPAIGFLHSPKPGRDSLVLDFMEPVRPMVDQFAIDLANTGVLTKNSFIINSDDGCRLDKKGRGLFFPSWAHWKEKGILKETVKACLQETASFFKQKLETSPEIIGC